MSYIPTESKLFNNWFLIPGFEGYLANKNGELLVLATNHITKGNTSKGDYCRFVVKVNGEYRNALIHRLICSAFYGPPTIEKYFVNHKNGVKQDNFYLNLEWVSSKENSIHAVETGLNKGREGRALKVYDVIDKVEICFASKSDLNFYIPNSSLSGIYNSIENKNIYFNRYFIMDLEEDLDFNLITYLTSTWFRVRFITDNKNKPDEIYTSVTRIAKVLGQDNHDFLLEIESGKILFGHRLVKKFNDTKPWPSGEEIDLMNLIDSPDVIVFSKSEKRYYIFRNATSAADHFNLSRNTIFNRCRNKNNVLTEDLLVKFLSDKTPLTFTV